MQTMLDKGMKYLLLQGADIPDDIIEGDLTGTITVALLADAIDLSPSAVVDSVDFQQTSSDKETERVYRNPGKVNISTTKNGSGTGVYRRSFTALGAPDTDDPLQYFDDRQLGLHIFFTSQGVGDAIAAGDEIFVWLGTADRCQPDTKPHGGFAKLTVEFDFAGVVGTTVVAA